MPSEKRARRFPPRPLRVRNTIIGRFILQINNYGLPSEYIGLPPCLQALHPGIPDETSATRSIIRSFHVTIICREAEGKKGARRRREEEEDADDLDDANYVAITVSILERVASRSRVARFRAQ